MKRIFLAALAMVSLISCSKDQTVSQNQEAIGFDNAFINNSTKSVYDPSYSSTVDGTMFSDFAVFGYVNGAVLFDDVQVSKEISNADLTSDWKYAATQYWIAGANYNFNAVAPKTNGGWSKVADGTDKNATKLSFTNNGTTDLLYAYATQTGKASGNEVVKFTFRHVLSKVKFSFTNGYNATNATIRVKNIQITDAYKTADVDLDASSRWSNQNDNTLTLNFGNAATASADADMAMNYNDVVESYNELLMIPGEGATIDNENEKTYTIKFKVELLVSETLVTTYNHTVNLVFIPEAGKCYDIAATINPENINPDSAQEPIEFTVSSISGWDTTNQDQSMTL